MVGTAIATMTGSLILGAGYVASLTVPPRPPTVVVYDTGTPERIAFTPSRGGERTTPTPKSTHDPLTAATDFAQNLRTYAPPTPTPSPTPVVDDTDPAQTFPPTAPTASPVQNTGVGGGPIPPVLLCIRAHESGGNYQAFNGIEHYGAYQLSATYSDDWARRYGYPEWADVTADQWPPEVQDAVAVALFNDSPQLWSTYAECS